MSETMLLHKQARMFVYAEEKWHELDWPGTPELTPELEAIWRSETPICIRSYGHIVAANLACFKKFMRGTPKEWGATPEWQKELPE